MYFVIVLFYTPLPNIVPMAITINIELTDHCNIKCTMCSQSMRTEAHGVPKKFMRWEDWKKALHHLEKYSEEVHLCPHWLGEPTIHPQFDLFIEYAFASNANNRLFSKFKLHTNAVQFSKERSTLLLNLAQNTSMSPETFHFVHFSVDAFSAETYKTVKGAEQRDRVFANIAEFITQRERRGLLYPKITIAFVVQPENAHEAKPFYEYWTKKFSEHKKNLQVYYDWPSDIVDCLYFRRLNCADQHRADSLHKEVLLQLGFIDSIDTNIRGNNSF